MTRGLTPAAVAAVTAERVLRTIAVELLFGSGAVRINGSLAPVTIGGQEFAGIGTLMDLSGISENWELQSTGTTLTLSGIPRDAVNLIMTEAYRGKQATVWEVWLDVDTLQVIADPAIVFRGRMDQGAIEVGDDARVTITLEDAMADLDRPNLAYFTDEDQRRAYPTDGSLRFVPASADKDVVWPAASFKP